MSDFTWAAKANDIPPGEGRVCEVNGVAIALFNVDGTFTRSTTLAFTVVAHSVTAFAPTAPSPAHGTAGNTAWPLANVKACLDKASTPTKFASMARTST